MRRLFSIVASVAILLLLLVPTALAAEPGASSADGVLVSVNGDLDVPAGAHRDTVLVIDGTARIAGSVDRVVVVSGSVTFTGATVDSLVVVDGTADLGAGTTVRRDVQTIRGTLVQQPGSTVAGTVRALDTDLAALALVLIPLAILFAIGFGLAAVVAGLVLAAFAARQLRGLEGLVSGEPGQVLVSGIVGAIALPVIAVLLIVTVVGAPIGLGLLLVVLPVLAFVGWLVAAVWLGDWLVERLRGSRETDHPYLAAILGVIVLSIAGLLPLVGTIATLFGFGALLLAGWRILRPPTTRPVPAAWTPSAPAAG